MAYPYFTHELEFKQNKHLKPKKYFKFQKDKEIKRCSAQTEEKARVKLAIDNTWVKI